jgi:hypothetical protein
MAANFHPSGTRNLVRRTDYLVIGGHEALSKTSRGESMHPSRGTGLNLHSYFILSPERPSDRSRMFSDGLIVST